MPKDRTHEEMISASLFDEKFKSAMRDYYTYGFKNYSYYEQHPNGNSRGTLDDIWFRLQNILGDTWSWSEKQRIIMCTSTDAQSNAGNPVHRLYRFCLFKDDQLIYFFHIIFALSPEVSLTDGVQSLHIEDNYDMTKEKNRELVYDIAEQLEKDLSEGNPLSTQELFCFYPNETSVKKGYSNLNNHLASLNNTGILKFQEKGRKKLWSLSSRKLSSVLKTEETANPGFKKHFITMLSFYSEYFPLGEFGTFLLDRMGPMEKNLFRFKHEYYMQALNDYDVTDILFAIENHYWCRISYSNGISHRSSEFLCFPLELRISSLQGREYLAVYEPFSRNYSFLRVEFIDSINYYKDEDIKSISSLSEKTIISDIKNVRKILRHTWGTSVVNTSTSNAKDKIQLHTVKMKISFNPIKEPYIRERMEREKRKGTITVFNNTIDFEINVADPHEMVPWIRSFYGRILFISGIEDETFTIENDLHKILQQLTSETDDIKQKSLHIHKNFSLTNSQKDKLKQIPIINDHMPHEQLFHEMFGTYYHIAADALTQIAHIGKNGNAMLSEECRDCTISAFDNHIDISGTYTQSCFQKDLESIIKNTGLGRFQTNCFIPPSRTMDILSRSFNSKDNKYNKKLHFEVRQSNDDAEGLLPLYSADKSIDFYRDLVPLSKQECRWLLAVLNDDKINYFLSEKEISTLKSVLNPPDEEKLEALPLNTINYFDRFLRQKNDHQKEKRVISILNTAIYENRIVEMDSEKCEPILLEYSMRDDRFRCYFRTCNSGKVFLRNLSSIRSMKILNEKFDYIQSKNALEAYRKGNSNKVTVQFKDIQNVPDRILTEFSPWKKECSYDPYKQLYTLTIHYQKNDKNEIIIRLMSYGSGINFPDKKDPICKEITARIKKQLHNGVSLSC